MLSNKRLKTIIKEKEAYLNALEEFDRTHKFTKVKYKERVNFTIDDDLMILFRKISKEKGIPMSKIIEKLIKEHIDKIKL